MVNFPRSIKDEKYALLIVNTYQLPNALNDTLVQLVMLLNWGFSLDNIYMLVDNPNDPRTKFLSQLVINQKKLMLYYNNGTNFLTQYNMILRNIAVRSKSNTSLYISISGHGGRIKDNDKDESDGFDECIYPAGRIVRDDDLGKGLIVLGSNFEVLCVIDTCHSDTMFDLGSSATKLKCKVLSIAACGDAQVDWETGCDTSSVKNLLRSLSPSKLSSVQLQTYLNYLPSPFVTGSLTSCLVEYNFLGVTDTSLNAIKNELAELGQTLGIKNSREVSDTTTSSWFWIVIWIVIFVILVIIVIVIVYFARKYYYPVIEIDVYPTNTSSDISSTLSTSPSLSETIIMT